MFRPQVYFQRKEEIDLLKDDFQKSGDANKSRYFHDLIMLGLKAKNEKKQESKTNLDLLDFKLDAILTGLETIDGKSIANEEKDDLSRKLKQISYGITQIQNKLNEIDKKLSIHEKALANIYQFTSPTFGNKKNIENGEYDRLPERFYR